MAKFYIKGTDIRVRTSKTHHYTHALQGHNDKAVLSCHESRELAEKAIQRNVSFHFRPIYGEKVIETGRVWVMGFSLKDAADSLARYHDRYTGQEGIVRDLGDVKQVYDRGEKFYGFPATEKDLEEARDKIRRKESYLQTVKIVELEER